MNQNKICLLGGDTRQIALACYLSHAGYECAVWGLPISAADMENNPFCPEFGGVVCADAESAVSESRAVILPLPATTDGVRIPCPAMHPDAPTIRRELRLTQLMEMLTPPVLLLAGMPGNVLQNMARDANIPLIDYYDCEEVPIQNAVPTAEGALAIAIQELPVTLYTARCTVLGYGRIGRRLADMLRALGAVVTVVARSEKDLCWAKISGCQTMTLPEFQTSPGVPDMIFNTVPAPILTGDTLRCLPANTRILELASAPGGIEPGLQKDCRQKIIRAASLPGKTAPYSAGRILYESIARILTEKGVNPT